MTEDQPSNGSWFVGGGEMGELMRATDWSQTKLGPVEGWPQSLRTMLGAVLGSRFPMLLWWGPELLQLYNDGYRAILRDKHPASLAAPAAQVWAEIWDVVGPMVNGVMAGGPATWTEDLQLFIHRGGRAEETYFTFSYSPVPGDDGRVGSVLNTVQETTTKVQGERQIRMLHELAGRAADAKSEQEAYRVAVEVLAGNELDLPFVLLYVVGDDDQPELVGASGWPGSGAGPAGAEWPFDEARVGDELLVDLTHFGPLAVGRWNGRQQQAVVLPLTRGGQPVRAFLVAGVSPHRALDDRYRRFFQATADQISSVLANAQAYESEKRRAEALAELDQAKTAFFSNVSHEFRTPLTLILGPIEDALDSSEAGLVGEPLQMVHRNTLRLMRLVNSLLDFSRIESGRAHATYRPSDLSALTTDLTSAFRSAVERAGLRFEVDCESLPEPIWIDHEMWEKIVLNLLSNALKFTFEGSIAVAVRWRENRAELEVRDTGIGIARAELPHLFERFHRVEGAHSRSHEGSGIGLALAADLVGLHGGSIRVHSEPDTGTTFTVTIPAGTAHLPPDRIAAERASPWTPTRAARPFVEEALRWAGGSELEAPPTADSSHTADTRILVVDDNSDLRDYIGALLGEHYRVETAVDGVAGLAAARRDRPSLILSDVMMPELDGLGLLRAVRADPDLRSIPVILLSARAGEEPMIEGLDAGADDYLVKPFAARELLARVRTHVELARQREVFERFFTLSLDMMCVAGFDGRFKRVSPAFDGLGYTQRELLADPFIDFVHPDDTAATLAELECLGRGVSTIRFENRYRCKDGDYRWLSWTAAPDALGNIYAIARDITETRETEAALTRERNATLAANRELERMNRQVGQASRLKSEFLANMSHELRTPLNSIIGFSELLHDGEVGPLEPQQREFLGDILTSSRHLLQLINDVLDLSRIEAGKTEFYPEPISVAEVIHEVRSILRTTAAAKRIVVEVDVPLEFDEATLDAARFKQVLYNYLSNALKFTPERGRVDIRVVGAGPDAFALEVEDSGPGIAARDIDRLFVEFEQLEPTRSQGTGLGLALTKRLVEAQGGRVGVRSVVGRGSVFFAELPRHAAVATRRSHRDDVEIAATEPGARRVLVIEDDPDDQSAIVSALRGAGYETETVATGARAIQRCEEHRYAAITLDLILPDMNGLDVLRAIRGGTENDGVPVVVVTVVTENSTAGFVVTDALPKPLEPDALVRCLERAGVRPRVGGRIAVVDDDAGARKLIEATLDQLGFEVMAFDGAAVALDALGSSRPAAVILDLIMPGMDGFEFLDAFHRSPDNRDIPVFVWTVKDLSPTEVGRLRTSARLTLQKGGGVSELVTGLREFLRPGQ